MRFVFAALALCIFPAFGQNRPARVAPGNYECWANGAARMLMNFSIKSATQYTNADGDEKGSYSLDAASGKITFKGGHLDGAMPSGFIAVYHEPKGKPTVSFRSPRGAEAAFCEVVR